MLNVKSYRYNNCAIAMEQHSAIIFPGDLTHLYHIKPKSSDVIVFLSTLHDSNHCIEMNGEMQCEGFIKN